MYKALKSFKTDTNEYNIGDDVEFGTEHMLMHGLVEKVQEKREIPLTEDVPKDNTTVLTDDTSKVKIKKRGKQSKS